jgi:hypothetical protein
MYAESVELDVERRDRGHRVFQVVELDPVYNNDAISSRDDPGDGALNVWGNTLPAESLPRGTSLVEVGGVPFRFPPTDDGRSNNVVCSGQLLHLSRVRLDWLHVLAAAERRTEDFVHLHYADGAVDPEWIRISDFWPAPARFGEVLAFRCAAMHYPRHVQPGLEGCLWAARVPVVRRSPLASVRLPWNAAIHVFALTAEEAA